MAKTTQEQKDYEDPVSDGTRLIVDKPKAPWWFLGFKLMILCVLMLYTSRRKINNNDYTGLIIPGIFCLFLLIYFLREFFKQHAQYSIKSLLILTFCVAILCSIYACFGFGVVFWTVLVLNFLVSCYFQKLDKPDK